MAPTGRLLFFFLSAALLACPSSAGPVFSVITPNFTVSNLQFVDSGAFLSSPNATFRAAVYNPESQSSRFYLCVIHFPSNAVVWSANPAAPVSNSAPLVLSPSGLLLSRDDGSSVWSTPPLPRPVSSMLLTDQGSLRLLDARNQTLWDSFDYPTDTVLMGQRLRAGTIVTSSASQSDLSPGNFSFSVIGEDAILLWGRQQYWSLSTDARAFRDSTAEVSYLELNGSGLYLYNDGGSGGGIVSVVSQVALPQSNFRVAVLKPNGQFAIRSWAPGTEWSDNFTAPTDNCRLPLSCGPLGLCSGSLCRCPPGFRTASGSPLNGCSPSGNVQLVSPDCSNNASGQNPTTVSYVQLGQWSYYFGGQFQSRAASITTLAACRDLCSKNCSCLGFFFDNSSSACSHIRDQWGSLYYDNSGDSDILGYVKTNMSTWSNSPESGGKGFPIALLILLPCIGAAVLIILMITLFLWWRRLHYSKSPVAKLGRPNSASSADLDDYIPIPGMPQRFLYEDLQVATDHFKTPIGSGGFGVVYKGTLPDKSLVAVKKITNLGLQGKKEFMTEIAVIGSIRHVNLVRLRGFCAQGSQRLLVYEYMNRGSLDRSLFGQGPILTWGERVEVALGTARGLAYLHRGCEQKIIHCDIKPENILLHDSQVKISDFGLSKLMTAEESNLFTTMRGTRGYLAPEWLTNAAISDKTDVYSYGMVLLEIVRGRKNSAAASGSGETGSSDEGSWSGYFPLVALEMHRQGKYAELADPRLLGQGVMEEEVGRLVRVALCCVQEDPALRPSMASVVAMLEGGAPVAHPQVQSLHFLRFYGRQFEREGANTTENANLALYRRIALGSHTSSSTDTPDSASYSYLSSQQISGPR